jgi:hypothetical protein
MTTTQKKPGNGKREAFRVPNSILQGVTTTTTAQLNKLRAFPMTVLLGLLTLVDSKRPHQDVRAKVSDLLEIIEVGKMVAQVVDREWTTAEGDTRRKQYKANRYNPTHVRQVNDALLQLHGQTVAVHRKAKKGGANAENRNVHILDMFGYSYGRNGRDVDVDDLPTDRRKVNVGTQERPVWRVRRRRGEAEVDERPSGVLFRLNRELAEEIAGGKQGISFTLVARRVFGVLRSIRHDPGAVRMVLLTIRQRNTVFTRRLRKLIADLSLGETHPQRAMERLKDTLEIMKQLGLIEEYEIDPEGDRIQIQRNPGWYREEGPRQLVNAKSCGGPKYKAT